MKERKYEFVKSIRCAGWLMYHGFNLIEMRPARENPLMKVYKFEQTPEFTKCMFEYINMRNGEKYGINNKRSASEDLESKCKVF